MSYDQDLVNRLREALAAEPDVTEQQMFGGLVFLHGGHIAVAADGQGNLLVRMSPELASALIGDHVQPMVMRGKPMPGYLRVDLESVATPAELGRWVRRSLDHVRTLPTKKRRSRRA